MTLPELRKFLDSQPIKYRVISHSLAHTAQGVAEVSHVCGNGLAKTVIVKIDGILAMAAAPASFHVDLDRFRALTGAQQVEIASEDELKNAFPDCETGAMAPSAISMTWPYTGCHSCRGGRNHVHGGDSLGVGSDELGRHAATRQSDCG